MLDKSIPYLDVIMRRKPGRPIPEYPLPEGYRFTHYRPGDEHDWASIETSVLEFDSEKDALLYFQASFMPFVHELLLRCVFVESPSGEKVATATAWRSFNGAEREPLLHWVAVKPPFQGMGLGKAVIAHVTQLILQIEGDCTFYLHTQTWSHKAVELYERVGFAVTSERELLGYSNDRCHEAVAILNQLRASREIEPVLVEG